MEVSRTHQTIPFSSFTGTLRGSELVVTKHALTVGVVSGIDSYFDLTVSPCLSYASHDALSYVEEHKRNVCRNGRMPEENGLRYEGPPMREQGVEKKEMPSSEKAPNQVELSGWRMNHKCWQGIA